MRTRMSSQWALGEVAQVALGLHQGFLRDRHPDAGGVAGVAFAEEAFGGDADDGDGVAGEQEGGADEMRVRVKLGGPDGVTDDGDGGGAFAVVVGLEQAAGEGTHAEKGEVVAGNEADGQRLCGGVVFGARADDVGAGLDGGHAVGSGGVIAELLVEVEGEDAPVVLQAAFLAALDDLADLVELLGVRDGQGAEKDLVGEGEDGGRGADAERQGEHGGDGEGGRLAQSGGG